MNDLKVLKRHEIDEFKWNELVTQSVNSLPYAYSWYLDIVADNWGVLVLNDYEAGFPLVWLRKFGIKCLYQPYYCQQLGIFSKKALPYSAVRAFIKATSSEFPYVSINLNPSAKIAADEFGFSQRKNLLLDLNKDYTQIQKKYSESHRRNIAKAYKNTLVFSEFTDLKAFQKFYLAHVNRKEEYLKKKHEKIFKKLTHLLHENKSAQIFSATKSDGELLAVEMMLKHNNKIINIINIASQNGKKLGASHFLMDRIIAKFSNSDLLLDFEGSSIPGVARFYERFGAQTEVFYNYKTTIVKQLSQRFI